MDEIVKALTEATENTLGAVFSPNTESMQRYSQAVQILADLERLGYRIERRRK